jgi:hypothetical protein
MIAFEVTVNGKKVCTAGVRKFGDLCAYLDWRCGPQVAPSTGFQHDHELLQLTVAGVNVSYKPRKSPELKRGFKYTESLEWAARRIRAGDEVAIRVVEVGRVDRPRKRRRLQ